MEIVNGFTGTDNVTAEMDGGLYASLAGSGKYVLELGKRLECTVISSNQITVADGGVLINGRYGYIRQGAVDTLNIDNGRTGYNRNDLVVAHYHAEAQTGIESLNLEIVKGRESTGAATDPIPGDGNILEGDKDAHLVLYRLPITDLTLGTPVKLFNTLMGLESFKSSFDRYGEKIDGVLSSINGDVNGLSSRMGSAEGSINSLGSRMGTTENNVKSLTSRMSTADTDRKNIWGNLNTAKSDINSLKSGKVNNYNDTIYLEGMGNQLVRIYNKTQVKCLESYPDHLQLWDGKNKRVLYSLYPPKNTSLEDHSNAYWKIKFKVTNNVCMLYVCGNKTSDNWGESRIGNWVIPSQYRPPFDIYSPMTCVNINASTNTGDTNAVVKTNGEIWWQNKGGAHSQNECTTTIVWAI